MKRILRIGLALLVLLCISVLGVHRAAAGVSSAPRPVSESTRQSMPAWLTTDCDTRELRHDARFEVEVHDGVWWVPANSLGGTRYTNQEMLEMRQLSPEEKREAICTLYEAIQLFQVSNFRFAVDLILIEESGMEWEHHKPGYHVVRTNQGCCASTSNWINYLLGDDYEEVGFVFLNRKSAGHGFNYIKHEGYYYIVDLTRYILELGQRSAPESGDLEDYMPSDILLGNVHKAVALEDYVDCFRQETDWRYAITLAVAFTAPDAPPVAHAYPRGRLEITFPEGLELHVLYDDPDDYLYLAVAPEPAKKPDWERYSPAPFTIPEP